MRIWTPEAERLVPVGTSGTLTGTGGAKAIPHCTVSPGGSFIAMRDVLRRKKAEPHYLYDIATDRLGQFFPLDRSARALYNPGNLPASPNKAGKAVIQIEFCSWPGTPDGAARYGAPTTKGGFTTIWKPGPKFRAMMRDIKAAGVPAVFPMGRTDPGTPRASWSQYANGSGWFPHSTVPGNDHWDVGTLNIAAFFAAAYETTPPPPPPVGVDPPRWPLPAGYYFGPKAETKSVSGYYPFGGQSEATVRGWLAQWQKQMARRGWRINTDGYYTTQTQNVARLFQIEKNAPDSKTGRISSSTWRLAWTAKVT